LHVLLRNIAAGGLLGRRVPLVFLRAHQLQVKAAVSAWRPRLRCVGWASVHVTGAGCLTSTQFLTGAAHARQGKTPALPRPATMPENQPSSLAWPGR
jgi:hypothetical protein